MKTTRERGRPARTKPGTALAISLTGIKREQRHSSPSTWAMMFPRLPAASHRSTATAQGKGCGRDARAPGCTRPGDRRRRSHVVQHPDVEAEGEGPIQALGGLSGETEDLGRLFGSEDQPRRLAKR